MSEYKPKVVVVGSFMMDLVVKAERRPRKGETLIGDEFGMFIGGKGTNQAIAAARLGAQVHMVGRLGTDLFGDMFISALDKDGINTPFIARDPEVGTGVGTPVIDAQGDNSIIIIPRANMRLSIEDVNKAEEAISEADVLLLQLEVPIPSSQRAAEIARVGGATVILNPAPARELPDDFLRYIDIVTPNETETEMLTGVEVTDPLGAERAAKNLLDKGMSAVVLTLGERGALLLTQETTKAIPAYKVEVVDTTAAGDAFCGALATAIARDEPLEQAVASANAAGAIAVTIMGAEPSMPTQQQLEQFLKEKV
ncbi:ribokinase [bacterium]|nr:ribokinase [bacterium]